MSASTAGAVKPGVAVSAPVSVTSGPPVFIARHTAPSAKVYSDEARSYLGLSGFDHEAVHHGVSKYVMAHTQGIESFWAMLKRAHAGTYHKISPKHLHRYIAEFAGKHNIRDADTLDQMATVVSGIVGTRLMYRDLIADR